MVPFPLFVASAYLRPKKGYSSVIPIITVCGVMLGVAILIIVLAVMTGFGDVWREKILSFKPHITVYERHGRNFRPDSVCDLALETPGVVSASPAIVMQAMVRPGDIPGAESTPVTVIGTDITRQSILTSITNNLVDGVFAPVDEGIVVGIDLARRNGLYPGSTLLCYSPLNLNADHALYLPEEMIVRGVYDLGMRDFDDGIVLCSLGMARSLLGMEEDGAMAVQIQTEDPEQVHAVRQALEERLGDDFHIETWLEQDRVLFDALRTEKTMMFILLAFIAIVAAFCVTNTLIVITIQKTKEIGLMKALGFSGFQIRSAFLLSGLIQCVAGEALGVGLGYLVLRNLQCLVAGLASMGIEVFPKAVYGLAEIPWRMVPLDVYAVVGTVFLFCIVASLLPAWLASRLDPVRAISQE